MNEQELLADCLCRLNRSGVTYYLILFCVQCNINNPIKTGEGLDLGG